MSANTLLPFQFANLPVRGRFLRLSNMSAHVPSLQTENSATQTLSELIVSAALLTFDAKYSMAVSLQIQHAGTGALLFAQCHPKDDTNAVATGGSLRAYANTAAQHTPFKTLTQTEGGLFAVTMEPAHFEQRYQSLIPLTPPSAADCLATYFHQSVQTPTILKVFSNLETANGSAAALMLQALPSEETPEDDWTRLTLLAKTLTEAEALDPALAPETLLSRLFAEDDLTLFTPVHPTFATDDPRPRMLAALASLPEAERADLIKQGTITLTDNTTGQSITFTAEDLAHLSPTDTTTKH